MICLNYIGRKPKKITETNPAIGTSTFQTKHLEIGE